MIPVLRRLTKGQTRHHKRNSYVAPVALLVMLFLIGQSIWLSDNKHLFSPFSLQRVPCDHCAKVGTVRDPDDSRINRMCPACFGLGHHMVRRFDEQDVLCIPCGGMGRVNEEKDWRTCRRCDGRGVYRTEAFWRETIDVVPAPPVDPNAPPNTNIPPPSFRLSGE